MKTVTISEDIANAWCKWQDETFPESTPESAAEHLLDEAQEVLDAIRRDEGLNHILTECVDCMGLLFYIINHIDPDSKYFDINFIAQHKLSANKRREWSKQENNVYHHTPEGKQ